MSRPALVAFKSIARPAVAGPAQKATLLSGQMQVFRLLSSQSGIGKQNQQKRFQIPHRSYSELPKPAPVQAPPVEVPIQTQVQPKRKTKVFRWSFLVGAIIGVGLSLYQRSSISLEEEGLRALPTNCEPFPEQLQADGSEFQLLGVGVRTVSIFKFHVYGLGIYIGAKDIEKAREYLKEFGPELSKLLNDDEGSAKVIDALLQSGIKFLVRIMPTRGTDFSHLRDGFVRSVMNHSQFKDLQKADPQVASELGEGIDELRRTFSRKRKVPKGDVITLLRKENGTLKAYYSRNESQNDYEQIGVVPSREVSRLFFLQYLSGKSPNSPTASKSAHEGLLALRA